MTDRALLACCRRIVTCDTARIVRAGGKLYPIIGFNRHTQEDTLCLELAT